MIKTYPFMLSLPKHSIFFFGKLLRNFGARLHSFFRRQDHHSALVRSSQKHALTFKAAQRGGLEIGNDNDLSAYELFRRVVISYPRADLALFRAEVNLKQHQLIGVRVRLGRFDRRYFEFHFSEFINGDHLEPFFAPRLLQEDSRTVLSKKVFQKRRDRRVSEGKNFLVFPRFDKLRAT